MDIKLTTGLPVEILRCNANDDNQNWCLDYTSLIAPLTVFVQNQQKPLRT